jgi:hypothetical protein
MDPSTAIIIQTFVRPVDADVAAAQLRGRGIEYLITSDDCGGMYPSLDVIKLLVDLRDAEAAREILGYPSVDIESKIISNSERNAPPAGVQTPQPRVYRFNSGLIVGVVVGVLLHIAYTKYEAYISTTHYFDRDNDGIADQWVRNQNGIAVQEDRDENFDGKKDMWWY